MARAPRTSQLPEPEETRGGGYGAGKQRRLPFPNEAKYRASHKLELIHGVLCGPVAPTTPSGNRFFFLLVDDLSRYMWVALLSSKDGAMASFLNFQARVEAETGRKVGTLRTDRGGEFTARAFIEHCCKAGDPAAPDGAVHVGAERCG